MLVTGMCLVDFSKYPLVLGMPELRGLWPGRYRVINMEEYLFGAIVAHHVLLCLWLELPQGLWAEEIHTWGDHSLGIFSGSHSYSRGRWISNSRTSSEAPWCSYFSMMPLWTGTTGPSGPHQLHDSEKATFAFEHSSLETNPGHYGVLTAIFIYTALSLITFKKQKQCFWLRG